MLSKYKKLKRTHKRSKSKHSKSKRMLKSMSKKRMLKSKKRSSTKKRSNKYKGGNNFNDSFGSPWEGGDIGKWPGVSGPHNGTYIPYKGIPSGPYDPAMPSNSQFQNGGGLINLIPQDLVNFGRSLTGGLEGAYSSYKGEPRFDSTYPLPIDQPSMTRAMQTQIKYQPLNLNKISMNAINSVSNI